MSLCVFKMAVFTPDRLMSLGFDIKAFEKEEKEMNSSSVCPTNTFKCLYLQTCLNNYFLNSMLALPMRRMCSSIYLYQCLKKRIVTSCFHQTMMSAHTKEGGEGRVQCNRRKENRWREKKRDSQRA